MSAPPRDLVAAAVALSRALRERGALASPAESADAARALDAVDVTDRREVYLALRAVLAARVEEYRLFDELFDAVWVGGATAGSAPAAEPRPEEQPERAEPGVPRGRRSRAPSLESWMRHVAGGAEPVAVPAVGEEESLARKDFGAFGPDELEEITRVAARLARRLAARPSRRWRAVRRGPRVHPRRTLRRALRTGGEAVELSRRARKPKKVKLVLLCDVSGSMDLYSRFLLQFLYALQSRFARVEAFVFGTRLSRVTEQLREESYSRALARLSREVHGWSGGTRIGECLAAFERDWSRLLDRRTVLVVLSDGWDTGEPEVLGEAMRALRRRAGKVIWLNPLLGTPGYRPLTRGMQAALPHLDVFAPAHNLESLRALARHLTT